MRDLIVALRALRRAPAFALTAVVTLSLAIGASTAIYSFGDVLMMRSLPVADPQDLIILNWRASNNPKVVHSQHGDGSETSDGTITSGSFPYPSLSFLRGSKAVAGDLFGFASAGSLNVRVGNSNDVREGEYVSGDYFRVLGLNPYLGRMIQSRDDLAGSEPVAVISYKMWQTRFGGRPDAIGQSIEVNKTSFVIIGVSPYSFTGLDPRFTPDLFLPIHSIELIDQRAKASAWFTDPNNYWVSIMGRIPSKVDLRHAEASMAVPFRAFIRSSASNEKERQNLPVLHLIRGGSGLPYLMREYSRPFYILFGMTSLITALACCNVTSLLLSRAFALRFEIAVRLSLGATPFRVARYLLTESIVIAVLGASLALPVGYCGIRALTLLLSTGPQDFSLPISMNWRVMIFVLLMAMLTGTLSGLIPAFRAFAADSFASFKEAQHGRAEPRQHLSFLTLGELLVSGQCAFAISMVVGAGLFAQTLIRLKAVPLGFNATGITIFSVDAAKAGYTWKQSVILYERILDGVSRIPGVAEVSLSDTPLVAGSSNSNALIIPGASPPLGYSLSANVILVGPLFFKTMQIPLVQGRELVKEDQVLTPPAVVVNQRFVQKFFSGHNPIGLNFTFKDNPPFDVQIVGVTKNTLYSSIRAEVPPVVYVPFSKAPLGWHLGPTYFDVRVSGHMPSLATSISKVVSELSSNLPITDIRTQTDYINSTIAPERTFTRLCICFALISLIIACVGVYGSITYAVTRRANEIGIRIALGAQRTTVVGMIQKKVCVIALTGIAAGLLLAWNVTRLVDSYLFRIRPHDLATFVISGMTMLTLALVAGLTPALRASQIDPWQAIRKE